MSQQPSPTRETPKEWARRVLAEHGPPPKEVEDRIRSIVRRQASK
jgi:hypothetical protein